MTTRTVTDTIRDPQGEPIAGARVRFKLGLGGYTAAAAYVPEREVVVTTADDGSYTATLWCDEESIKPVRWRAFYPYDSSSGFGFDLPVGASPVAMATLRVYEGDPGAANLAALIYDALQTYLVAGDNVSIDNVNGQIVISATGGGVTIPLDTLLAENGDPWTYTTTTDYMELA